VQRIALAAVLVLAVAVPGTALTASAQAESSATSTPTSTTSPTVSASPSASASPTSTANPTPTATPSPTATPDPATVAVLSLPSELRVRGPKKGIPWPKTGHAQLAVAGIGVLGRVGDEKAAPIASITKVMTAYVILRDHPLAAGKNGPTIVVTAAEAASYGRRKAQGESLVRVAAGERISQRRALQGLLLASGNNMADILARWDAGSISAFVAKMNSSAADLEMTSTHYADASGLNARSRSTTTDLLRLAPAAMADPTFKKIVSQTSARIPLNKIKNTNKLLGRNGVIGIKTGSTLAAGGCLLFAAERTVSGRVYTVYGALLGAPGPRILTNALARSDRLIVAARKSLRPTVLIRAGRTVATLTGSDGIVVDLTVAEDVVAVGWTGLTYSLSLPTGLRPGQAPATLTARTSAGSITVPLIATR
jgi:D-alanyl-D-alanine carboxypeptidase (penicillin-binding protein 5/6)